MNPGRRWHDPHYERLLDAPPEHLHWEIVNRVVHLRRVVDDLREVESRRNTRWIVIEISILLVFSIGLVLLAIMPLWVGVASLGTSDDSLGFPTTISGFALLAAPIALYALHSVYRSYRRIQHRRHAVDRFSEYAIRLIEDAQELAKEVEADAERG